MRTFQATHRCYFYPTSLSSTKSMVRRRRKTSPSCSRKSNPVTNSIRTSSANRLFSPSPLNMTTTTRTASRTSTTKPMWSLPCQTATTLINILPLSRLTHLCWSVHPRCAAGLRRPSTAETSSWLRKRHWSSSAVISMIMRHTRRSCKYSTPSAPNTSWWRRRAPNSRICFSL